MAEQESSDTRIKRIIAMITHFYQGGLQPLNLSKITLREWKKPDSRSERVVVAVNWRLQPSLLVDADEFLDDDWLGISILTRLLQIRRGLFHYLLETALGLNDTLGAKATIDWHKVIKKQAEDTSWQFQLQ